MHKERRTIKLEIFETPRFKNFLFCFRMGNTWPEGILFNLSLALGVSVSRFARDSFLVKSNIISEGYDNQLGQILCIKKSCLHLIPDQNS